MLHVLFIEPPLVATSFLPYEMSQYINTVPNLIHSPKPRHTHTLFSRNLLPGYKHYVSQNANHSYK
jgi:hypothetical protein